MVTFAEALADPQRQTGFAVGETARSGSNYERAQQMDFHICRCDRSVRPYQYVAAGAKRTVMHLGPTESKSIISCGLKEFHQYRPICRAPEA